MIHQITIPAAQKSVTRCLTRFESVPKREDGNVLIISLIMLAGMTVFGLTAMRGTLLEEKISLNQKDQHLALEGAQSAISVGLSQLPEVSQSNAALPADGYYDSLGGNRTAPSLALWTTSEQGSYSINTATITRWGNQTEVPRYKIEKISTPGATLDSGSNLSEADKDVTSITYFRLIGRGEGIDERSLAVIETIVRRGPPPLAGKP